MRLEWDVALKQSRMVERENKRLKLLTSDLGRQVQVGSVCVCVRALEGEEGREGWKEGGKEREGEKGREGRREAGKEGGQGVRER